MPLFPPLACTRVAIDANRRFPPPRRFDVLSGAAVQPSEIARLPLCGESG
jgi:hypothetical protein